MIVFSSLITSLRVLRIINNCIYEMLDFELSYCPDEDEIEEFAQNYFPKNLCRENPKKYMNILIELKEWSLDSYLHQLTCLHEYALFKIFNSYFDCFEGTEEHREKYSRNVFKFNIRVEKDYTQEEKDIIKNLNNRKFYLEDLFNDWDFLNIEKLTTLYQTNPEVFDKIGIDLSYYLDLMPNDIKKTVEESINEMKELDLLNQKNFELEFTIITQIKNAIKMRERYPERLYGTSEDELSDDIKDIVFMQLEKMHIIVQIEARGGFANKKVGENDFYIYKVDDNGSLNQIALGENKVWNNFEKQIKQLIGYMNENIKFGFTIAFNKSEELCKVREKQLEILEGMKSDEKINIKSIIKDEDIIISLHTNPENNRDYRIYHLVANAYYPERKKLAKESRKIKNN